jgi:HEAT repeats
MTTIPRSGLLIDAQQQQSTDVRPLSVFPALFTRSTDLQSLPATHGRTNAKGRLGCLKNVISTALLVCSLGIGEAAAQCASLTSFVQVTWEQPKVTVCASQAPVSDILREIARKTGIRVLGLKRTFGVTSLQVTGVSLDSVLNVLLKGVDYIVVGDLSLEQGTPLVWIRGKSPSNGGLQQGSQAQTDRLPASADEEPASEAEIDSAVAAVTGGTLPEAEAEDTQSEKDPTEKFVKLEAAIREGDEHALAAAVLDSDPALQTNAHEALKAVDAEAAKDALVAAMDSDLASTRLQALQLLQQSSQDDARTYISALEKSLADTDEQVRIAAVQGLVRMGGPEEMSFVRQAFKDTDPAVRLIVISSAGSQDRSLLSSALEDSDETVRGAAAELLKEIQNSGK